MSDALCVKNLSKHYRAPFGPGHHALCGLSLAVPKGSAFGLIGPNGAGKTTFIKVLLGVVRATAGQVTVLGGDPQDLEVRARIGYLPEKMHLPSALRARDFLRSVSTLKSLTPTEAELGQLLERVGLENSSQRIGTFSKGMRQRLGLAAAMLGKPELLILDEPTDGIDPLGRIEVRSILLEEKGRGATILLNSHLLSETEKICDRIGVLSHGQLKLEGTLEDLRRTTTRWVVTIAGNPAAAVDAGFTMEGPHFAFEGEVAAINAAIDSARAHGLQLTSIVPVKRDLEAVLSELEEPSR